MTKTIPILHLKDVRYYYGQKKVVDIPELLFEKGSITGITGPNGSGKTTLLKMMAFAQKPFSGQILFKGQAQVPFSAVIRSKLSLLTQKSYLLKRTIFENVIYGLKIRKDLQNIEERIKKTLLMVGLDYDKFAQRKWYELSSGEAQRVALAARLILKPDVLLLDEPTAGVDIKSSDLIRKTSINARDSQGTTLVIVSHDLSWLYSISDRLFTMNKGKIFAAGMENIIPGPFEKFNENLVVKKIDDGQIITLKSPLKQNCIAVIKRENIIIDIKKQNLDIQKNQLSGNIASMMLEKKNNNIIATIVINEISFVLRVMPDQISRLGLYPGKNIIIRFHPDDIEWIE